jgi:signal peptidase II
VPAGRYVLFLLIVATGVAADLWTKQAIFSEHYRASGDHAVTHWWIDGVLGIQTSFNGGALFGMFQGGSWWLAGLSVVALGGIAVWLFVCRMATSRLLTVTLGMISAGILGNLHDRVGLGYSPMWDEFHRFHVRDWIHFRLEGVKYFDPWPNFNIADSLLVTGALLLFCFAIFSPGMGQRPPSSGDD